MFVLIERMRVCAYMGVQVYVCRCVVCVCARLVEGHFSYMLNGTHSRPVFAEGSPSANTTIEKHSIILHVNLDNLILDNELTFSAKFFQDVRYSETETII